MTEPEDVENPNKEEEGKNKADLNKDTGENKNDKNNAAPTSPDNLTDPTAPPKNDDPTLGTPPSPENNDPSLASLTSPTTPSENNDPSQKQFKKGFANKLLERESPDEYTEIWTQLLMKEKKKIETTETYPVVIFRLRSEWFALSSFAFKEVSEVRIIHKLPHIVSQVLLGVINIRGQLSLCIAMHNLLEVEECNQQKDQTLIGKQFERMVVAELDGQLWAFPVDEIFGMFRCKKSMINNSPVTVAKSMANYLKGVFIWKDKSVGFLDDGLIFNSLQRIIV